jgi:uncharacterized integral membrane protein
MLPVKLDDYCLPDEGDGAMDNKWIPIMVLGGFVALFIIQNIAIVEVQFLFWSIQMSRSLLILSLLVIGVAIGWLLHGHLKHSKEKSRNN